MSGGVACQLSQEVGFLRPRILRRNCRPAKSGEKNTDSSNRDLGLALCFLSEDREQPPLSMVTSMMQLSLLLFGYTKVKLMGHHEDKSDQSTKHLCRSASDAQDTSANILRPGRQLSRSHVCLISKNSCFPSYEWSSRAVNGHAAYW